MKRKFSKFNSIGKEELREIRKVLKSGNLSNFYGEWSEQFFGGKYVRKFEEMCAEYFEVKHAITFNSWTSGLEAAVGAIEIEPGDEVIVSPWTMSASAMAILHWNAIPVFCDIDKNTYCLDPSKIEAKITSRTKAIMTVDIFGQSSRSEEIMKIAQTYNLKVISDSAQAPGAMRNGKFAGTLTHFGGISLNYHKHIHTGEGGVLFTNDDNLALRAQLIRNHAEAVVAEAGVLNLSNMIGHNFRMTELQAAIGIAQLPKLKKIADTRTQQGNMLSELLQNLPGLSVPKVDIGNSHVYYTYAFQIDPNIIKVEKEFIIKDLTDQGVPYLSGKYPLLHLLPIFQNKIAYGNSNFPWSLSQNSMKLSYSKGICPEAEELFEKTFIQFYLNALDLGKKPIEKIANIIKMRWQKYI